MVRKLSDLIKISKEELQRIKKDDLIAIIHKNDEFNEASEIHEIKESINEIKNTVLNRFLEENKNLKQQVELLSKRTILLESEHWRLNQYTRRNNIEISGIPDNIESEKLEDTIIKVIERIGVKCDQTDREACHHLPSTQKNN